MGGLGGLGSLSKLGTQSIGQSIGYGISKAQLGDAYNQWKKSLKRGPTYTAIGLERAGLNRILAAGGGVGATSAAGSVKANAAGMGGSSGNASLEAATAKAALEQARLTGAQADIAGARRDYYLNTPNSAQKEFIHQTTPTTPWGAGFRAFREWRESNNAKEARDNPAPPWLNNGGASPDPVPLHISVPTKRK